MNPQRAHAPFDAWAEVRDLPRGTAIPADPWRGMPLWRPRAVPSVVRTGARGDVDLFIHPSILHDLGWTLSFPDLRPGWPDDPHLLRRRTAPTTTAARSVDPFDAIGGDPAVPFFLDGVLLDLPGGWLGPGRPPIDDDGGFGPTWPPTGGGAGGGDRPPANPPDLFIPEVDPFACPDDDEPCPGPVVSVLSGAAMSEPRSPQRWQNPDPRVPIPEAYYPTALAPRCQLIVLLHGASGEIGELRFVAQAYAAAGYRVLLPIWASDLPLQRCCTSLTQGGDALASIDPATWNDCLVEERLENLAAIEAEVVRLLRELNSEYPSEGWANYLRPTLIGSSDVRSQTGARAPVEPPLFWQRIILAGYSSGANQSAFIARLRPVAGLILNSGGGDGEGPPPVCGELDDWDPPLAAWMTDDPLPARDTFVGFRHAEENFDFSDGWNTDGIPNSEVEVQTNPDVMSPPETMITSWDVFGEANPVVRVGEVKGPPVGEDQHGAVLEDTVGQTNVNLYLACRAGGRR